MHGHIGMHIQPFINVMYIWSYSHKVVDTQKVDDLADGEILYVRSRTSCVGIS